MEQPQKELAVEKHKELDEVQSAKPCPPHGGWEVLFGKSCAYVHFSPAPRRHAQARVRRIGAQASGLGSQPPPQEGRLICKASFGNGIAGLQGRRCEGVDGSVVYQGERHGGVIHTRVRAGDDNVISPPVERIGESMDETYKSNHNVAT